MKKKSVVDTVIGGKNIKSISPNRIDYTYEYYESTQNTLPYSGGSGEGENIHIDGPAYDVIVSLAKFIECLKCCGNCAYGMLPCAWKSKFRDKYCNKWHWDNQNQEDRK